MTLAEWLAKAEAQLLAAGIDSPRLEAQLLAAHAIGESRSHVLAHPKAAIDQQNADQLLARRCRREPLAYITGSREFYGRSFKVGLGVLVPRPETEVLVDAVLAIAPPRARVLDLGTGSGCIALTLALERSDLYVVALDVSRTALEITGRNALALGVLSRIVLANGLSAVGCESVDLIVCNPPYVAAGEKLMPEVAEYEPPEALYAGKDGLDVYRCLAKSAWTCLAPGGQLALEHGKGQRAAVKAIFSAWELILERNDLSGIDRVLVFQRPTRRPEPSGPLP